MCYNGREHGERVTMEGSMVNVLQWKGAWSTCYNGREHGERVTMEGSMVNVLQWKGTYTRRLPQQGECSGSQYSLGAVCTRIHGFQIPA